MVTQITKSRVKSLQMVYSTSIPGHSAHTLFPGDSTQYFDRFPTQTKTDQSPVASLCLEILHFPYYLAHQSHVFGTKFLVETSLIGRLGTYRVYDFSIILITIVIYQMHRVSEVLRLDESGSRRMGRHCFGCWCYLFITLDGSTIYHI